LAKIDVLHPRPLDATLSVTRAAEVLGVHANTVRAWSDAGRLRYYRINPRGDRRYRQGDLQRFLAGLDASAPTASLDDPDAPGGRHRPPIAVHPAGGRDRSPGPADDHRDLLGLVRSLSALSGSAISDALAQQGAPLTAAVRLIREALAASHVSLWRLDGAQLVQAASAGNAGLGLVPRSASLPGQWQTREQSWRRRQRTGQ